MSEQVQHLLQLSVRDKMEILILPIAAGLLSRCAAPFGLYEFVEQVPAVCLNNFNSLTVLEAVDIVAGYWQVVCDLLEVAMPPHRSADWLRRIAPELTTL